MQIPGCLLAFLKMRDWWALFMCFLAKLPRQVHALKPLFVMSKVLPVWWCFSHPASSHSQSVRFMLGPMPVWGCSPASVHLFGPHDVSQCVHLLTGSPKLGSRTSDLHEFPGGPSIAWAEGAVSEGEKATAGVTEGRRVSEWDGASASVLQLDSVGTPPAPAQSWRSCLPAGKDGALPSEGEWCWNPDDRAAAAAFGHC